jgi:hypothetical protein
MSYEITISETTSEWKEILENETVLVDIIYNVKDREMSASFFLSRSDAHELAAAHEWKKALCEICLCSQNSMSSKEECGRIARAALAKAEGKEQA